MNTTLLLLAMVLPVGQIDEIENESKPATDLPTLFVVQEKLDETEKKETEPATPKTKDDPAGNEPASDSSDSADEPARLFPYSRFELIYDRLQSAKEDTRFPFTFGAWNWGHINNGGPNATDYGIPGLQGTYFWYIVADPWLWKNENEDGFFKSIGGHFDFRFRENDKFRDFFGSGAWFWENYAYVDTKYGKIKGGQIWKRFGMDWDGTFWGNVPYFDGFTLDPDWGFSWEHTWDVREKLKVDTYLQYFIHEDGINGSIRGADSESLPGYTERHTGVVRIHPKWQLNDNTLLATGISGLIGQLDADSRIPGIGSQVTGAWALDATLTHKKWKVFGQFLQSYGVRNPVNYVSEGPSNRNSSVWCGLHYTVGPVILRCCYSVGWDANPNGMQRVLVPGMTVALTKNLDFYCEYVRWDVRGSRTPPREFEDGFQLILNWRF